MSWDEAESRVAKILGVKVLGVKEGRSLPKVSKQTLKKYLTYLRANLEFPFETPLVDVFDIDGKGQNKQILEDYCMWFWNYR
jgi:hypothetical protein